MQLAPGVRAVFTDRSGGASAPPYDSRNLGGGVGDDPAAVRMNRDKTAAELGVERVVYMRQVHSAKVRHVTGPFGEDPPGLDGI
jgi:polyphenol oxidase